MATKAGDSVAAKSFNALFDKLEAVRALQVNRADLTSTQRTNLASRITGPATAGSTPKGGSSGDIAKAKTAVALLATNVNTISDTFASSITIPTVGELLKASNIQLVETAVTNVENACVDCTFFSSNFTSHKSSDFSHRSSNFSDRSHNSGHRGHNASHRSHNSSQFSYFSNNSPNCPWFSSH